MQLSREMGRQVGILVNRRGLVQYVIVGERDRIEIPPLSAERVGRARFRGLRFIHTHLKGELLSKEDLTELALLQLDLVCCITERKGESGDTVHVGYLIPENRSGNAWDFIGPMAAHELDIDFIDFITELEAEFVRERGRFHVLEDNREKALLVLVVVPKKAKNVEEEMAEMKDLCDSADLSVLDVVVQRPKELHPKYLIGKGKMEEIFIHCRQLGVNLLVFDEELYPAQLNAISSLTDVKVIDRNQLILDIFASRARTSEAKLQVELAQLRYILPRLAEKNTALSRLTGGIGLRGPGETKLEIDRRRIRERIGSLEKKLDEVRRVRESKREKRRRTGIPIVSIVGYTNSGKSTLLNLLTKSTVEAGDRLFSTLSPTTRLIKYPQRRNIIVTDTVGFVENLPQVLLRAFAATLEELEEASLLVHLVDISSPEFEEKIEAVDTILSSLHLGDKRKLLVFNKIDKVDKISLGRMADRYHASFISAAKREGIEGLVETIEALTGEHSAE